MPDNMHKLLEDVAEKEDTSIAEVLRQLVFANVKLLAERT